MGDIDNEPFYQPPASKKWLGIGFVVIFILLVIIVIELVSLKKASTETSIDPNRLVTQKEGKKASPPDQTYEQIPGSLVAIEKDQLSFSQGNNQNLKTNLSSQTFLLCNPGNFDLYQVDYSRFVKNSLQPSQYLTPEELKAKLKPNAVILMLYKTGDRASLKNLQGIVSAGCL